LDKNIKLKRLLGIVKLCTMGFYSRYNLSKVIHLSCMFNPKSRQREKVVPLALIIGEKRK